MTHSFSPVPHQIVLPEMVQQRNVSSPSGSLGCVCCQDILTEALLVEHFSGQHVWCRPRRQRVQENRRHNCRHPRWLASICPMEGPGVSNECCCDPKQHERNSAKTERPCSSWEETKRWNWPLQQCGWALICPWEAPGLTGTDYQSDKYAHKQRIQCQEGLGTNLSDSTVQAKVSCRRSHLTWDLKDFSR